MKPNITSIDSKGVHFTDGSYAEADAIILATGYNISFPFLDSSCGIQVQDNSVELFKYVFPLNVDPKHPLGVIGLVQPLGAIMPLSEMQSRWFVRVACGKTTLPHPVSIFVPCDHIIG